MRSRKALIIPDIRGNSTHLRTLFLKHFESKPWHRVIFLGNFFAIPSLWPESRRMREAMSSARLMADALSYKSCGAPIDVLWSSVDLAMRIPISPGFITKYYDPEYALVMNSTVLPGQLSNMQFSVSLTGSSATHESGMPLARRWLVTSAGLNLDHYRKHYMSAGSAAAGRTRIARVSTESVCADINKSALKQVECSYQLIDKLEKVKSAAPEGSAKEASLSVLRQAAASVPEILPTESRGVLWNRFQVDHNSIPGLSQVFGFTPGVSVRSVSHSESHDYCCDVNGTTVFELDLDNCNITELS